MPTIAQVHPQIGHFVVALLVVPAGMRTVSLSRLLSAVAAFPHSTRLRAKLDSLK